MDLKILDISLKTQRLKGVCSVFLATRVPVSTKHSNRAQLLVSFVTLFSVGKHTDISASAAAALVVLLCVSQSAAGQIEGA